MSWKKGCSSAVSLRLFTMMTTPTLITPNPITDGQKDSIVRLAEEAVKTGFTTLNLTNPGGQRLFTRGDEFKARIIAAMNELSVPLPDLDCFGIADWRTLHRVVVIYYRWGDDPYGGVGVGASRKFA